ncbi:uncharacterized protein LAESUDRAFT_303245 [Laetiporus sulphureus 93-53]|uniref:Methyltransferase domain-containing protein n=1 Tax=Laetiporus sulphureus 93-53 TaxID=1314785 RepID=A0A165D7P2_9APHY|nr:uncharacterized protein LAESUDRAFT_303245 [Laetiporus sulphureus 93-53]KZT04288.1 hypothetical protein LAESUDRAFT_303245 [Laetiporus sulphureus 93-53]
MTPKHFLYRHPLLTALTVISVLLVFCFFPPGPPNGHGGSFSRGRGVDATRWAVMEEEARYEQVLRERQMMVRKWGPTPERVEAFPLRDDFYTLWDFYIPAFQCPHRVDRVGTLGDGGKWLCGLARLAAQPSCVVYSFGVNNESSFEAALLRAVPGCQVWGYDFSVRAFGPEIEQDEELRARAHFAPWALGPQDGVWADGTQVWSLASLMQMNGHEFIDVLKIDIEGAEFAALSTFIDHVTRANASALPPPPRHPHGPPPPPPQPVLPIGQLQIELHARPDSGYHTFARFNSWWESLEAAGLRPFFAEPNLVYVNLIKGVRPDLSEYSFMNIRGRHALVTDRYL